MKTFWKTKVALSASLSRRGKAVIPLVSGAGEGAGWCHYRPLTLLTVKDCDQVFVRLALHHLTEIGKVWKEPLFSLQTDYMEGGCLPRARWRENGWEGVCRSICAWHISTWFLLLRDNRLCGEGKSAGCWTTLARADRGVSLKADWISVLWLQWSESPHCSLRWLRSHVILGQGTLGSFVSWMRGETRVNLEKIPNRRNGVCAGGKTTLWREDGTGELGCWQPAVQPGHIPWLVMVQDGAHGLLSSPDSLILFPSSSVFKEKTHTCLHGQFIQYLA